VIKFDIKTESEDGDFAEIILKEQKGNHVHVLSNGRKNLIIGIDKKENINLRKLIILFRQIVSLAKSNGIKKFVLNFSDFRFSKLKIIDKHIAEIMAVNLEMANFEFVKYKNIPKDGWNFIERVIVAAGGNVSDIKEGIEAGQKIGSAVNDCRVLVNTPGGDMTPSVLAEEARKAVGGTSIKLKVLDEKDIEKLGMGGIIGVSKGSVEKPRFIILEYKNNGNEKPIVLVGKGVTFDSGGLVSKTADGLSEMHMDMSGAAAVIQTVVLAAKLGIKKNVVGLIPAAENMPSGSSYRPGDILRSMSGKTIEVLNTDAEGRIILADALTYADKYKPRLVVDVASLTGASIVALGQKASAIFTKDEGLEKLTRELGEESGDYVWPMPLWDEYEDDIRGNFGDVANLGKTRYGGAITGAIFLYQFVKDFNYPWMHIDMAPKLSATEGDLLAKGAAGAPVRLLIKLLERF
jgi:leucyl aminopeptidase